MDEQQKQASFEGWAIVEMMGHQREIGYVTTAYFGSAALFRVDAPEIAARETELERPRYTTIGGECRLWPAGTKVSTVAIPAHTRFVSPGALYALTPCTEETARKAIEEAVPSRLILLHMPQEPEARALPAAAESSAEATTGTEASLKSADHTGASAEVQGDPPAIDVCDGCQRESCDECPYEQPATVDGGNPDDDPDESDPCPADCDGTLCEHCDLSKAANT